MPKTEFRPAFEKALFTPAVPASVQIHHVSSRSWEIFALLGASLATSVAELDTSSPLVWVLGNPGETACCPRNSAMKYPAARPSRVGAPPHKDNASCRVFLPSQKPSDRHLVSRCSQNSAVFDDTTSEVGCALYARPKQRLVKKSFFPHQSKGGKA